MRTKLKKSLEETDLKLLDAKINAIKDKSSREKVNLLCKIIDNFQTKTKQKRDIALQMIMDNFKISEERKKANRERYYNEDKEASEELSTILAGNPENKEELLIQYVNKVKKRSEDCLKLCSKQLIDSQAKLS